MSDPVGGGSGRSEALAEGRGAAVEGGRGALAPALLTLLAGLAAILLRDAIPLDETRYLEVLRESLARGGIGLFLGQRPYLEKPPLLFWIGGLLTGLGLPLSLSLRLVPALASAGTVLVVGALGRRARLPWAAWLQAATIGALIYAQVLLFDPLLSLAIWLAVLAWTGRRDGLAGLAAAGAYLAKGPVAAVYLVPLLWAFAPLRPRQAAERASSRGSDLRRGLAIIVLGLVPVAAWAIAFGLQQGPEVLRGLLWERWGNRVSDSFAHARPIWFYLPLVLLGTLPCTLLVLSPAPAADAEDPGRVLARRLARSAVLVLVLFSLMSGKQPHYLLPAVPMVALLAGWKLRDRAAAGPWLWRAAVALVLLLLLALALATLFGRSTVVADHPRNGPRLLEMALFRGLLALALAAQVGALWLLLARRATASPALVLGTVLLAQVAAFAPLNLAAGVLSLPQRIAARIATLPADEPLAVFGRENAGYYCLAAGREVVPKIHDRGELADWLAQHPEGYLLVDADRLDRAQLPPHEVLLEDEIRGSGVSLLWIGSSSERERAPTDGR